MNIGQLDGQPLALQIFNGMTAESICVNERWAKDQLFRCVCFAGGQIKSTPSIAWRTLCFNLRPPCGGRRFGRFRHHKGQKISIHVLRVEDDVPERDAIAQQVHFNPRPPCGGRPGHVSDVLLTTQFQSTSSVWRTTVAQGHESKRHYHFNPRPPCGGRPS